MRSGKIALAALLAVTASSAHAQVATYTNTAAFQAAAGNTTLETFNAAAQFNTTGAFGPKVYTGFSLSGDGNGNSIGIHSGAISDGGPNYAIPTTFNGQNFFSWGDLAGGAIKGVTFTFAQPTTAFAFDWFNTDYSDQYQIKLNTGETYTAAPFTIANGSASSGFFGIVSAKALTSATITNVTNGGYMSDEGFDNVRVSAGKPGIAAVPEPGSVALMAGMGLSGAGFLFRRRRQARKSA